MFLDVTDQMSDPFLYYFTEGTASNAVSLFCRADVASCWCLLVIDPSCLPPPPLQLHPGCCFDRSSHKVDAGSRTLWPRLTDEVQPFLTACQCCLAAAEQRENSWSSSYLQQQPPPYLTPYFKLNSTNNISTTVYLQCKTVIHVCMRALLKLAAPESRLPRLIFVVALSFRERMK
jgi:hypothetical protein